MQVAAVSTPGRSTWCWRIVNYAGETVEESRWMFPTSALAIDAGTKRLKAMGPDRSVPRSAYRSASYVKRARREAS